LTNLHLQAEQLQRIKLLVKTEENRKYQFLGYTLDLETSEFHDQLEKGTVHGDWDVKI